MLDVKHADLFEQIKNNIAKWWETFYLSKLKEDENNGRSDGGG